MLTTAISKKIDIAVVVGKSWGRKLEVKVGVDVSVKVRLLRANGGVLLYPVELFFRDGKQQCSSFFEASLFRAGEKVKPLVLILRLIRIICLNM